jgi:urease accessory protein
MLGVGLLGPLAAAGHTGIGTPAGFGSGLGHPLGGADHLLAMIAVGLWAAQLGGRAVLVVPAAFVTLMTVGGMLAVSGIHVPYVEQGVAASVLILGMLIAAALRFPLAVSGLVVGLFAVFHGHAHGAEMPPGGDALPYGLGFALTTALLHAVGIGCATVLRAVHSERAIRMAGGAIVLGGVYLTLG